MNLYKKDYERAVEIVRAHLRLPGSRNTTVAIASAFEAFFRGTPGFDVQKFRKGWQEIRTEKES